MKRLWILATLALIAITTNPTAAERRVPGEQIERHIRNLVHDDAAVRDAAGVALVRLGAVVVGPLTKAMEETDSPEFHGRAREILLLCKPGGPVVDGLQLTLTTNRTELAPGRDAVLTTVIKNTTAKDVNVYVGMSYSGNVFEVGSALVASDAHDNALKSNWIVGFCGTGAYPIHVTIPANGSVTYASSLKVRPWPERVQREGQTKRILSPGPGYQMVALPGGAETIRVRMSYSASGEGRDFGGGVLGLGRPANPKARYWSGSVESNELQLSVLPAAEK
jgi:hypothetical protein